MRNSVETLRVICFTREDLENVTNLGDAFSDIEIDFMVEFKKIYELGLGQLAKFIDKLDEEGKDLDVYTIQYYVYLLLNGPLGSHTKELSKDKQYFSSIPNSLGFPGNLQSISANTTSLEGYAYPLGCEVGMYNKLPAFFQKNIKNSTDQTEELFRSSVRSSTLIDNTLPIADKAPQSRYDEEYLGLWVTKSNASYMVKDSYFSAVLNNVSSDIFDGVEEFLGDENFRIYTDRKTFTQFSDENDSVAINSKQEKKIQDGEGEEIINLDLMGEVFDSVERRQSVLKVSNPEKDKEYLLNSVEGQLGS